MAGDVINLRQARKRKARAEKDQRAAENRTRFGRSKAARLAETTEARRAAENLAGHRRDEDGDGND